MALSRAIPATKDMRVMVCSLVSAEVFAAEGLLVVEGASATEGMPVNEDASVVDNVLVPVVVWALRASDSSSEVMLWMSAIAIS
jgi:hypothetical protein